MKALRHLLLFVVVLPWTSALTMDLNRAYQLALINDPQIREAQATLAANNEVKPHALSQLLPQVSASGALVDSDGAGSSQLQRRDSIASIPLPEGSDQRSQARSWQYQVQLTQPLFRWDRWVGLQRADVLQAQATMTYKAAEQDLVLRVAGRYFDVLAAQDVLDASEATLEAFQRQLDQSESRHGVGLLAISDVQEARAARDQSKAEVIAARGQLTTTLQLLREITGESIGTLAKADDNIVFQLPSPADAEAWVSSALDGNPRIVGARLGMAAAKMDVSIARTGRYPTLDLVASRSNYWQSADQFEDGVLTPQTSEGKQDAVFLQLAIPIYSGGAVSSQVRRSVALHRVAREQLERAMRETETAARDAYLRIVNEIERAKALEEAVKSVEVALRASEAGVAVGTRSTLDVLEVRSRLLEAQTSYALSRYDYLLQMLQLQRAAGNISADDLAKINTWITSTK